MHDDLRQHLKDFRGWQRPDSLVTGVHNLEMLRVVG
jgi:hypothetical protein